MAPRTIGKWQIDMGGVREATGLRKTLGIEHLSETFGIRFRGKETRFTVRTSDLMTLTEIERILPQLARLRYAYHHTYGTGNEWNRPPLETELTETLEKLGVHLPGWLR